MNNTILLISIIGSVMLVVMGLLFAAGFLIRRDLARMRAAGSSVPRATRDPLALRDTLVAFFAQSKGASRVIRLLTTKRKPLGYQELVDEVRFDEQWRRDSDELPAGAILALLGIMQVAGLVRLTQHGFGITEVGREVHRRIEPERCVQMPKVRAVRSISKDRSRAGATLSSPDRRVLREHRKRAHTLIHQ